MMIRTVLLLAALTCQVEANQHIRIYGYDIEAKTFIDSSKERRGKHHGGPQAFLTELVRELMIKLKHKPNISPLDQARKPSLLALQKGQAVWGVGRNKHTEDLYQWVGPLLSDSAYFLINIENPKHITSIEGALTASSICVRQGSRQASTLQQRGFKNLHLAGSYTLCWDRLAEGKSELTTLSAALLPAIRKSAGRAAKKIIATEVKLYDEEVYLAFSITTPNTVVEQFQAALEDIKTSMRYDSLIHHYYCRQDCF